jgi:DNA processing protein
MTDATQRAWAYLSRVVEPPCAELAGLVSRVGPVEAAERVRQGQVDDALARRTQARREIDRAVEDLELLARRGGRLIAPDDDEWPVLAFAAFGGTAVTARPQGRPPMTLWVLGPARLDDAAQRAAAVVGTRAATSYGEHVAADLAVGLAERDVAVVSGGAYGIDGAAHRAALSVDGLTVAVLAGGIDIPYPAGHSALLHRIATDGSWWRPDYAAVPPTPLPGLRLWAESSVRCLARSPPRRRADVMRCCAGAPRSSPAPRTSSSWWVGSGSWLPSSPIR